MPFHELSPIIKALYAVWLAVLGGTIGSFLNVVVYRVPAGLSLSRPGSHCPSCKHAIRWHDNVPVLGWIWLRGRCRDCGASISARYPTVEAVVAAMFLALGWVELLAGGINLPVRPVAVVDGLIFPPLGTGQLVGILGYHLFLLCTLLSAGLIEWDGHRLPVRVLAPAAVLGLVAPIIWPHLHPMPVWPSLDGAAAGLVDGLVGAAVGVTVGAAAAALATVDHRLAVILTTGCTGLSLGYQFVLLLAAPLVVILLVQAVLARLRPAWRGVPPTAWLALLTFTVLMAWKPLMSLCPW